MKKLIYLIITIIAIILYSFTMRGNLGNPTPQVINTTLKSSGQAFETSQERARYALILSLVNDHTFAIDHYAAMGTPDIGRAKRHYYSFFPPGTSILATPLYLIGLKMSAAQMMTFLISTIFAFLTMIMIIRFVMKLGLHWSIALFSAVAFGFATNAWGYSVTLYAHLISAFLILLGLYLTLFLEEKRAGMTAVAVWTLYALAVFLDFPNLLIYFPIALILTLKTLKISQTEKSIQINLDWRYLVAPLVFLFCMAGYGYYNYVNFGSPTTLSNFLPRVKDVGAIELNTHESSKDVTGALQTRSMLEGFRSFIVSDDRGIIKYSPVILLFVFGFGYLKERRKKIEVSLFAIAITCLTLYTMFGDPYGGWAFGSRYLIAIMPELCILAGIGLQQFYKNTLVKSIYTVIFTYSAQVALLSPLTTNVIPPKVEAQGLHLASDYTINWNMLANNELNSFFYNHILHGSISGFMYYYIILAIVLIIGMIAIWYPNKKI
jgi:hypothetical protein